ncbi:FtsJ-like methyltransferase, putative [Leishmania panamensis]|uniref:Putative tRNA (cytidine(32)/guanosine(34)-2'-O)-methyltransferase n=1 Tax=Leishmania panamensis TaxID=5679 RepID=A0A088RJA5_LEIPA|nr:FtsJ-like methyltransferase, putative [Leishmania panamensis]AIN95209.1 FtsJ-like methyltransferase, putative [Leishmania panamensis]
MGRASKDKRDIYYRKAKEEGYRARSAYKLLQIEEEFHILDPAEIRTGAVDLCAAPGSWSQVLAQCFKTIGANATAAAVAGAALPAQTPRVVAVDLQEMAPIDGVAILQGDITSEVTANEIIRLLNAPNSTGGPYTDDEQQQQQPTSSNPPSSSSSSHPPVLCASQRKADIVLCDGAPDVTGMHELDEYLQHHLLLAALHITTFVLRAGGCFLTKMFRGPNTAFLIAKSEIFFEQVRVVKPKSSRNASMESFLLCQGFRMPPGYVPRLISAAPASAVSTVSGGSASASAGYGSRAEAENEEDMKGGRRERATVSGGRLRASGFTPEAPSYCYGTTASSSHVPAGNAAAAAGQGVALDSQRTSCTLAERVLAPFLSCGDLSGFDADMCYDRDEEVGVLEPVQPPLQAPYLAAAAASLSLSAEVAGGQDTRGAGVPQSKKLRVESQVGAVEDDPNASEEQQQ